MREGDTNELMSPEVQSILQTRRESTELLLFPALLIDITARNWFAVDSPPIGYPKPKDFLEEILRGVRSWSCDDSPVPNLIGIKKDDLDNITGFVQASYDQASRTALVRGYNNEGNIGGFDFKADAGRSGTGYDLLIVYSPDFRQVAFESSTIFR